MLLISGKTYYMYNNYTYTFNYKTKYGFKWRCTSTSKCSAYILMNEQEELLRLTGEHNHPPPKYTVANGVQDITMMNGKKFKMYKGYTYSHPVKTRQDVRYNCTQGCKARLYLDMQGNFMRVLNENSHTHGTFLWTKRGGKHPLLVLSGYTYSYQKQNADGRISWYCSRRLKGCRASAISVGTRALAHKPHDHAPPKLPDHNVDKTYISPAEDAKYII